MLFLLSLLCLPGTGLSGFGKQSLPLLILVLHHFRSLMTTLGRVAAIGRSIVLEINHTSAICKLAMEGPAPREALVNRKGLTKGYPHSYGPADCKTSLEPMLMKDWLVHIYYTAKLANWLNPRDRRDSPWHGLLVCLSGEDSGWKQQHRQIDSACAVASSLNPHR